VGARWWLEGQACSGGSVGVQRLFGAGGKDMDSSSRGHQYSIRMDCVVQFPVARTATCGAHLGWRSARDVVGELWRMSQQSLGGSLLAAGRD